MASVKISALPAAGTITGAELVPVVQGGTTKKATASTLITGTTAGGDLSGTYPNPTLAIGNPGADGYLFSSTAAGVRTWKDPSTLIITSLKDSTDPTKVDTFDVSHVSTATTRTTTVPDANNVLVVPDTGASNNFLTGITALGAITKAQPTVSNISGAAASGANADITSTTALNTLTAASTTNLALNAGSSGATAVLGQGTNGAVTLTPKGTGQVSVNGTYDNGLIVAMLYFGSDTNTGWSRNSANQWTWISGNSSVLSLINGQTRMQNGQVVNWSSTGSTSGADTGISRVAAGVVGVGTGGNAAFDGTLKTTSLFLAGKATTYNNITTAGNGIPSIVAAARVTVQSAANASIATYTTPGSDGSYEVSMNMNVTAATGVSTTMSCTYTDESNTSRTMIFPTTSLSGTFLAGGLVTATGAFETPVMHIRCKASTAITLFTSTGTFTGVTYTAEGIIKQMQ